MEDAILSLEKNAMERWRHGDPMGWAEISAEDVIYMDPGLTAPLIGLEDYKVFLRNLEGKVHYQGSEFIAPKVVLLGEAAILTYNYRSTRSQGAGVPAERTLWNTTEVYFRRGERWQIVHTHWSFVQHGLPKSLEIPMPVVLTPEHFEGVPGEVMAYEMAAMQRWRKGDPWGFIELYAPEITYFDTGTPQRINGLDAMCLEMAAREGKIHYEVMEFIAPRIQVQGSVAVLSYRFLSTHLKTDGSIAQQTPWYCSEVYAHLAGKWRILHNHWSYIRGEKTEPAGTP